MKLNFIDRAKLKALLYKINCGLLFDRAFNGTKFTLSKDDLYSRNVDLSHGGYVLENVEYNLFITGILEKRDYILPMFSKCTIVMVDFENYEFICQEYNK